MRLLEDVMEKIELAHGRTEPILWEESRGAVEKRFSGISFYEVCKELLATYRNKAHSPSPFDFLKAAEVVKGRTTRDPDGRSDESHCKKCIGSGYEEWICKVTRKDVVEWMITMVPCSAVDCPINTKGEKRPYENYFEYEKWGYRRQFFRLSEREQSLLDACEVVEFEGVCGRTVHEIIHDLNRREREALDESRKNGKGRAASSEAHAGEGDVADGQTAVDDPSEMQTAGEECGYV